MITKGKKRVIGEGVLYGVTDVTGGVTDSVTAETTAVYGCDGCDGFLEHADTPDTEKKKFFVSLKNSSPETTLSAVTPVTDVSAALSVLI